MSARLSGGLRSRSLQQLHGSRCRDWAVIGLVAGCAAMVIVAAGAFRVTGTGKWAYLAVGVAFGLGGLALLVHTVGVRADMVGAALAVVATLGCLAVPRLTARLSRFTPPREDDGEDVVLAEPPRPDVATSLAVDDVWARVRSATMTRSGLYAGVTVSAGLGALVVQFYARNWAGLTFALCCAATLGLYGQRPAPVAERAALGIPAVALAVASCVGAQRASAPIPLTAFAVVLALTVGLAVVGANTRDGRPPERVGTLLAYLTYVTTAALIPLALWAVGAYERLGIS